LHVCSFQENAFHFFANLPNTALVGLTYRL